MTHNADLEAIESDSYYAHHYLRNFIERSRDFLDRSDRENIAQVLCLLDAVKQGRSKDVMNLPPNGRSEP